MLMTPQQLWKDYDRNALPLNTSIIKTQNLDGYSVRYFYFNGEKTAAGVTRIYAKMIVPDASGDIQSGEKRAVLVMDEIENGVEGYDFTEFLSLGYNVLIVDYAGENPELNRFTIYQKDLAFSNYFHNPDCLSATPQNPKHSCWYVYTVVALRSIAFLESLGINQIAMLGIGDGAPQVFKAAYFPSAVNAGAIKFSSGIRYIAESATPDNEYLSFMACLDSGSYAPNLKAPVFIQATSNERNSSLDRINGLYEAALEHSVYFAVSERSERTIVPSQKNNISYFFNSVFNKNILVSPPLAAFKVSDQSLYFEVKTDSLREIADVKLYVAQSKKQSAFRNWQTKNIEKISSDEYLAKIKVFYLKEPIYAYATVSYTDGFTISTNIEKINPAAAGIAALPFSKKRLIYDSDMEKGDFIMLSSDTAKDGVLSMEKGPFDIKGISSSTFRLSTFALADNQYMGERDSVLQLTIYSELVQTLEFKILASDLKTVFSYSKEINPLDNWTKLSLPISCFRAVTTSMESWEDAVTFEISGVSKFLINSMLWV